LRKAHFYGGQARQATWQQRERERGSHKSALKSRMVLTVLTSTASTGNQIDLLGNGPLRWPARLWFLSD